MHINFCPAVKCMCPGVLCVRTFMDQPNYLPFYKFRFSDYIQRVNVIKTYNVRHLPMTQGKSTERYLLDDPPEWDVNDAATGDDPEPAAAAAAVAAADTTPAQPHLEYDSEQDEWIEVHFICPNACNTCPVASIYLSYCLLCLSLCV